MPRTVRAKKPQPTLTKARPQADAAASRPAKRTASPGRKANGQFARGNSGGPGNPHARFSAYMLTIARQTMTPEKIAAVFESIYVKALSGDMAAAKLLLHYTIGKPGDAPHPDHIERDEWDLYQKNAMSFAEVQQALGSLPCSLGNEIVGAALPAMTAARAEELAAQLRGEGSGAKNGKKDAPNGRRRAPASKSTQDQTATAVDPWDIDTVPPLTNGTREGKTSTEDSHHPFAKDHSPATKSAPIPNGNSSGPKKARKLVAKQWLQPLAAKLNGHKRKSKQRCRARA